MFPFREAMVVTKKQNHFREIGGEFDSEAGDTVSRTPDFRVTKDVVRIVWTVSETSA